MSLDKDYTAQCSECGASIPIQLWDYISADTNPRAKKKLLDGSLFKYKCKKCSTVHFADYPFFYSDADNNFAVYYLKDASRADATNESFKKMSDMLLDKYPDFKSTVNKHRIVKSYNGVLEKIAIFENGLDDAAVEIMKTIYLNKVLTEYSDITVDEVLFFIKEGDFLLQFNGSEQLVFEADKNLYEQIKERFEDAISEKTKDCYIIDTLWARDLLNSLSEK